MIRTILGLPANAIHAESPGVYTSENSVNLYTTDKIHLKCDVFDGSVVNGIQEPIIFSFISHKPPEYKVFCEPETSNFEKINKPL